MSPTKMFQIIVLLFLLQTLNLFGEVKFEFIYADKPGTGFHKKPKAKKALEEIGRKIGRKWLKKHNAHIKIKVVSTNDSSSPLGYAVSLKDIYEKNLDSFFPTYLEDKIIHGKENPSLKYDGLLNINFSNKFCFNGHIRRNQTDFKAAVLHEMAHLLGIHSNALFYIDYHERLLKFVIHDFIKRIFYYGINSIEGKLQSDTLSDLQAEIDLIESSNIDISKYILNQDSLPPQLEELKNKLFQQFINSIKNSSSITRSALFNSLNMDLLTHQINFREFIEFDFDLKKLIIHMMLFGTEKLTNVDLIEENDEIATMINFKVFYFLNKNNYLKKLEEVIYENFSENKNILKVLNLIIKFNSLYIINENLSTEEITRIKNQIASALEEEKIVIDDFPFLFRTEVDSLPITIANYINSTDKLPRFFDKFVQFKTGEKLFNPETINAERIYFLHRNKDKRLYFTGPKTLKYLRAPIPLYGQDASHVSTKKVSLMNPMSFWGISYIHEWDKYTTAMLLDLGYKVENYWTRCWKRKKHDKKFESTLKRTEKIIKTGIKLEKRRRKEINKIFRNKTENKFY